MAWNKRLVRKSEKDIVELELEQKSNSFVEWDFTGNELFQSFHIIARARSKRCLDFCVSHWLSIVPIGGS
jgi:hypothetical protein